MTILHANAYETKARTVQLHSKEMDDLKTTTLISLPCHGFRFPFGLEEGSKDAFFYPCPEQVQLFEQ
jgi:hypothetical protein